ncbi:DinB family protein [Taibaiella lutea]|uniref:DinB family protein n=1 Tax=Taibaiella lutea TaxID=2608001 RepID=A0A5M6CJ24_9BACT|nr:DinB family protein [Taibaiella lutea]KAA5533385.1 DinB family protein [Taibaiella lutea]
MHFQFAIATRKKIADKISKLSIEQLNKIPTGCNNNIAWQLGHLVVSSEILCYHRTGIQPDKEIDLADKYRNGSRPESFIEQSEIDDLLKRFLNSYEAILEDYNKGIFKNITPYTTHTFGVEMTTIEEVFSVCSHHDVIHAGQISIMERMI